MFLALQLTFFGESATAMTGDMVNLALFALCIFCFLRARILQDDRFLALLSFAFGAAALNDWGVIGFCPLFFAAILWAKGISFFEAGFLIRTTLAGLAGTLFYLIPPIALQASGQADGSILELLRTQLAIQRTYIFAFPRATLAFSSLASILPLARDGHPLADHVRRHERGGLRHHEFHVPPWFMSRFSRSAAGPCSTRLLSAPGSSASDIRSSISISSRPSPSATSPATFCWSSARNPNER